MTHGLNDRAERAHYKTITPQSIPEITQTFFVTKEEDEQNYGLMVLEAERSPPAGSHGARYGRINNFFGNKQEVINFLNLIIRNEVTLTTLYDTFRDYIYEKLENAYSEGVV